MRIRTSAAIAAGLVMLLALPALAQDGPWFAWSPKPDTLTPYGKNQPVTRLPALLAKHKNQKSWSEQVIQTRRYDAKWIQMAPGEKTRTQYYGDDRVVWVVWGGQIRFTIDGEAPFVASKGFLVDVPQRVRYSMETVGDAPSLRFEVTHAGMNPNYPGEGAKPANARDGTPYIKVSTPTQPDKYDAVNRPYVDFFKDVVAADPTHGPKQGAFVADEANFVNIIRGQGVPTPPASNLGHFHIGDDEFWFILEGKCDYQIEGVGLLTADAGDVVLAPPGRFHRASWANGQMDTRLAFNPSPLLFHNFGEDAGGKQ